jgi:hypothetical protein
MRGQPRGHGIGGTHRQHLDHPATLQVDENRAEVVLALLPGPVIDATTRTASASVVGGAPRFTRRTRVSALITMLRRPNTRAPARPPNA